MVLVLIGAWERKGIEAVVEYTAPVFWLFFLLTGLSIFVLRTWERIALAPFALPSTPSCRSPSVPPAYSCSITAWSTPAPMAMLGLG